MTDERTEKLARAICASDYNDPDGSEWDVQLDEDRAEYLRVAEAALAAVDADPETYGYRKPRSPCPECGLRVASLERVNEAEDF